MVPMRALPATFRHPDEASIASGRKDLGQLRASEAGSGFEIAQRTFADAAVARDARRPVRYQSAYDETFALPLPSPLSLQERGTEKEADSIAGRRCFARDRFDRARGRDRESQARRARRRGGRGEKSCACDRAGRQGGGTGNRGLV